MKGESMQNFDNIEKQPLPLLLELVAVVKTRIQISRNGLSESEISNLEVMEFLAAQIEIIRLLCRGMEVPAVLDTKIFFADRASFYDSAAVLNPTWSSESSQVRKRQAEFLSTLAKMVEIVHELEADLEREKDADQRRVDLGNVFN